MFPPPCQKILVTSVLILTCVRVGWASCSNDKTCIQACGEQCSYECSIEDQVRAEAVREAQECRWAYDALPPNLQAEAKGCDLDMDAICYMECEEQCGADDGYYGASCDDTCESLCESLQGQMAENEIPTGPTPCATLCSVIYDCPHPSQEFVYNVVTNEAELGTEHGIQAEARTDAEGELDVPDVTSIRGTDEERERIHSALLDPDSPERFQAEALLPLLHGYEDGDDPMEEGYAYEEGIDIISMIEAMQDQGMMDVSEEEMMAMMSAMMQGGYSPMEGYGSGFGDMDYDDYELPPDDFEDDY